MIKVPVSGGRFAFVDDVDKELLDYNWTSIIRGKRVYAIRCGPRPRQQSFLMHRQVIGARVGEIVDHINGDGLDNRRENLRRVTNAENLRNRLGLNVNNKSGFLGVSRYKSGGERLPWQAKVGRDGKQIYLGHFRTKEEAAEARRKFIESNPL